MVLQIQSNSTSSYNARPFHEHFSNIQHPTNQVRNNISDRWTTVINIQIRSSQPSFQQLNIKSQQTKFEDTGKETADSLNCAVLSPTEARSDFLQPLLALIKWAEDLMSAKMISASILLLIFLPLLHGLLRGYRMARQSYTASNMNKQACRLQGENSLLGHEVNPVIMTR